MDYLQLFNIFREATISGRYLTLDHIEPLLSTDARRVNTTQIGNSVQGRPIYKFQIGHGSTKVLMWSQMHGNESTTTKAVLDLFNFLDSDLDVAAKIKSRFTICIVPMLNPDGAKLYTRENANGIDLNRDAQDLSQPESQVLRKLFVDFEPHFCFNLHDQRTIYGAGNVRFPATISFLAPAYNQATDFNDSRVTAISVIYKLNKALQKLIPNQVGRYDDSFNINCVGDTFQLFGVPTILFEAGHFPQDYQREETRKYIFVALLESFTAMFENEIVDNVFDKYLSIPLNKTNFLDIIYKNVNINYDNTINTINFAAQYIECLIDHNIVFEAFIEKLDDLDEVFGHQEYDLSNEFLDSKFVNNLEIGKKANFCLQSGTKFVNGNKI